MKCYKCGISDEEAYLTVENGRAICESCYELLCDSEYLEDYSLNTADDWGDSGDSAGDLRRHILENY